MAPPSLLQRLFGHQQPPTRPADHHDTSRPAEKLVVIKHKGQLICYRVTKYGELVEQKDGP